MRELFLAATMLAVASAYALADETTGKNLYQSCIAAKSGTPADQTCNAYINGIANGILVDQVAREQGTPICLPSKSTTPQIRSVIEKFLRDHPEFLNYNAGGIVGTALAATFPCPKSN